MQSKEDEEDPGEMGKGLLCSPGRGVGSGEDASSIPALAHLPISVAESHHAQKRREHAQLALPTLPAGRSSSASLWQRWRHTETIVLLFPTQSQTSSSGASENACE